MAKAKTKKPKKAERKCSICSQPGHNARSCPGDDLGAEEPALPEEPEEPEEEPEEEEEEEDHEDEEDEAEEEIVEDEEDEEDEAEGEIAEDEPLPIEPVATKAQLNNMGKADSKFHSLIGKFQKAMPGQMERADLLTREISRISTGNIGLDIATFGGLPRGRIIRFFGREKSAKSGSAWNTVACWQHQHCGICYERGPCDHGKVSGFDRPKAKVLWIDAEHRVADMYYWPEGHGVDLSCLLVQEPPSGQYITDVVHTAILEHGAGIGLIVVDSVANFTSQEEIDKATVKGRTMAVNAALLNKALRKWVAATCKIGVAESKKPTIILVNQMRQTMDQYTVETMPGGEAQKYATSIDVRFQSKRYHHLVENEKGEIEDKCKTFGSRWKAEPDDTPYYVEIDYRITSSGVCPNGRYGQFNYWLKEGHGRRIGDPDNVNKLWDYVKRLDLMKKAKNGYELFEISGRTQDKIKEAFYADTGVQAKVWGVIVETLIKP